jgi:hypothetical protein
MQKPSLRFRQVFEHPTHFKVTRAMGNPITVAKKGLSPSLMGRLRKFSNGTGEVPEPTEQDQKNLTQLESELNAAEPKRVIPFAPEQQAEPVMAGTEEPALPEPVAAQFDRVKQPFETEVEGFFAKPMSMSVPTAVEPMRAAEDLEIPEEPVKPIQPQVQPVVEAKMPEAKAEPEAEQEADAEEEPLTPAERRAKQIDDLLARLPQAEAERQRKEAEISAGARASAELDLAKAQGAQQLAWNEFQEAKKDKGSYLSRLSTPKQIGTIISLALGSFAAGWKGLPNVALKLYEDAVNKDLETQRRDENSVYNKYIQSGVSVKDAEALVKSTADRALAADLASAGKDTLNLKAQVEALRAADNMERQANIALSQVMRNLSQTKEANVRAEELPKQTKLREQEAARKEAKDKADEEKAREQYKLDLDKAKEQRRHNIAQEGLSARERKVAEDRLDLDYLNALNKWDADAADRKTKTLGMTMNINGLPVPTTQEIIARDVPKTVRGMDSFLRLATEIDDIFAKNPVQAFVTGTDANTAANLKLKELLERYPKSEGYQRPLNVTASRVIDAGLQAPTSVISGAFGKPRVVMQNLIDDLIQNRNELIRTSAAPTDEGKIAAQKAIESYGSLSSGEDLGVREATQSRR